MNGIPVYDIVKAGDLYLKAYKKPLAFKDFLDKFNRLQNKKIVLVLLREWVLDHMCASVAPEIRFNPHKKIRR